MTYDSVPYETPPYLLSLSDVEKECRKLDNRYKTHAEVCFRCFQFWRLYAGAEPSAMRNLRYRPYGD
jgi:hypothetical protein